MKYEKMKMIIICNMNFNAKNLLFLIKLNKFAVRSVSMCMLFYCIFRASVVLLERKVIKVSLAVR